MVVFELLGRACVQFWLHWRVASLKISCESNVTHKTAKLTSLAFFICKHKGIKQSKTSAVIYYFLKNFLWLSAIPSCKLWKWLELFFFSLPLQIMIPKIKKKNYGFFGESREKFPVSAVYVSMELILHHKRTAPGGWWASHALSETQAVMYAMNQIESYFKSPAWTDLDNRFWPVLHLP